MSNGLSFNQKLHHRREFDRVFKPRRRLYSRYFVVYYCTTELPYARIGMITAKRNVRLAVRRNRVRRVVKEQFRLNQTLFRNLDIVFVARKDVNEAENKEISQCIQLLLKKLKTSHKER